MVKANVDRILDMLSQKNSISTGELSKELKIKEDDIQKSAEYLEQDGIVKIERKWPRTIITLIQKKALQTSVPPPPQATNPTMNLGMPPPPKIMTQPQEPTIQTANPTITLGMPPPPKVITQEQVNKPNLAFEQTIQLNTQDFKNTTQTQNLELKDVPQFSRELLQTDLAPAKNMEKPQAIEQQQIPKLSLDQNLFDIKREEPNVLITSPEENLRLAKTLMSGSDPLDAPPRFDMRAPEPVNSVQSYVQPDVSSQQFNNASNIEYPTYIRTDAERVSFIMDQLSQKINSRDYSSLNSFYRQLFNIYTESDVLSPNERYLLGEKIQDIFDRIKNVYLVEKAI